MKLGAPQTPGTLDGIPLPSGVEGANVRIVGQKRYKTVVPVEVRKYLDGDGG